MQPWNEDHDAALDRNLRMIGRSLELPSQPSASQVQRWRRGESGERNAPAVGGVDQSMPAVRRSNGRWVLRWAGFGSALAACVAFGVMLLSPIGHARVDAAEILASLADKLCTSIRLTIENLEDPDDGIRVDGRVLVVFPQDDAQGGRDDARGGVCGEFRVRGNAESKDFPGGELDIAFALAPAQEWVFLRTRKLPRELLREAPAAAIIYGMTCNGMLLQLDGLLDGRLLPGMDKVDLDKVLGEVSGSIRSATDETRAALKAEINVPALGEDTDPQMVATLQACKDLQDLLPRLMSGQANGEELRKLVPLLEQAAGSVTVNPSRDGAYVLEASEFKADDGDADAEWIRRMVLRIVYRPQQGVERAEVLHLGPSDGRVVIEFGDGTLADELFVSDRLVAPGRTSVVNVTDFMKLLGPMIQQGGLNIELGSDDSDDSNDTEAEDDGDEDRVRDDRADE